MIPLANLAITGLNFPIRRAEAIVYFISLNSRFVAVHFIFELLFILFSLFLQLFNVLD